MREDKRARLEAKGWKVGSTADFLHLSPVEAALIEVKVALSHWIKVVRKHRSLTQSDFAAMIRSSQSRVAKMEAGDPSVTLDLLVRSLLALGVSGKDVGRIIAGQTPHIKSNTVLSGHVRAKMPSAASRERRTPTAKARAA